MHVPQYAEPVAQAFVEGKEKKSPLCNIGPTYWDGYQWVNEGGKGRRLTTDGKQLLSYDWWVVAKRGCGSSPDCILVTKKRYQTGTWKSGKPKYSPTTDGHIQSVKDALRRAGYEQLSGNWYDEWYHYMKFD